jgi:DNA ligase-1
MNTDNMQHGYTWQGQDVSGWIASEKFDGIRAYWDGQTLWTRGGKAVPIPQEWRNILPAYIHLDGELFAGYGQRKKAEWFARAGKHAEFCTYRVFDAPTVPGRYLDRMLYISDMIRPRFYNLVIRPIAVHVVGSVERAARMVKTIQAQGGEGLILRHPDLAYTPGRTDQLLKLKTWELN